MKKKPKQSLADYVTIALSPTLIMALVGSLIFFLLEVLYVGQYSGRMQWTLFFFVFGIVLVARISIEQGGGRATIYGIGLAIAVWVALLAFIEYPAGSSLRFYGWAINIGLIAIAWWCAHRLTWDCTYIDDSVDAAGKGVLEAAGLDDQKEERDEDRGSRIEDRSSEPEDDENHRSPGLFGWWDRYRRYRKEQLRKPHTPGVWVVYFSLAALPLFGLGQSLIPAADAGRRYYVFWLMVCYVGSGLALLVTTSFLGLRRYLRQRKLTMPAAMTGIWMALGGGLIVLLMVVGALLPRPYGEYQVVDFASLGTKERNASPYAVLRDGAGKGQGRPSSDRASKNEDAQSGSGKQANNKQGEKGSGDDGKQSGSGNGKGAKGQSSQDGKGGGNQRDPQDPSRDGNSGRQENTRSESKLGAQQKGQAKDRPSDEDNTDSKNRGDKENKRQGGGREPGQKGSGGGSDKGQADANPRSLPHNPLSDVLRKLSWLGTILKWLVFAILALVVLFFVLRSGLQFLANFTNWARRLLEALQAWWQGLFGRGESEPEAEMVETVRVPRPRPFASFSNPFLDGRAEQLSADTLTRYSFEALQAWAWEHRLGRQPQETPLEFAERLATEVPDLENQARSLAGLYVRLAYARGSLTPACLALLQQFWQRLETLEDKPVSV